ncbi:MAG: dihydropteroate synthase [Actinomycetes bacterium]
MFAVVNASPESFSGNSFDAATAADAAAALVADGADVIDIGAQSLRTDQPELPVTTEIERLLPVLEAVRTRLPAVVVSVDTYRCEVAAAALPLGFQIVNDPSGLMDERMASFVGANDLDYVLTYNIATPKVRLAADALVADPVRDCEQFLSERLEVLARHGVARERVVVDFGADLGKSPDQTVEILRSTPVLRDRLGVHRVLWALSRKDFIGALIEQPPRGRAAGTLGAIAGCAIEDRDLVRIHDVRSTVEFFTVQRALRDGATGPLELRPDLRHNPVD